MKVEKTASAADQGNEDGGVQGDAVSSETLAQNDGQVPAGEKPADTASSDALPAIALEHPSAGGSYIRQADGTLVKQEG